MAAMAVERPRDLGVRIEAQFTVGEYEVVVLSASDSMGLDTWLRQNRYQIPAGAEPILRPYVQAGMKFFVAKVDVKKVQFEGGMAMLSPLRFHYDAETFGLPVRLGLLNSAGTQDLIVHILARGKRYEVANYPNVTIPTNYDVADSARSGFGAFYAALFDRTLQMHPGAVVTEYAWDASSCDPCPTPALEPQNVTTLGADVLDEPAAPPPPPPPPPPRLAPTLTVGDVVSGNKVQNAAQRIEGIRGRLAECFAPIGSGGPQQIDLTATVDRGGRITQVKTSANKGIPLPVTGCLVSTLQSISFEAPAGGAATVKVPLSVTFAWTAPATPQQPAAAHRPRPPRPVNPSGFVLTRLHARYGKDALGQDLVFREAPAIEGGRENYGVQQQEHGAKSSSENNFQGRYAIRHPWTGPIKCDKPQRNVWGGPPAGVEGDTSAKPALKVAFAPRGQVELTSFLREGVPELEIPTPAVLPEVSGAAPPGVEPGARGCGSCDVQGGGRALLPASIAALCALLAHERRRRRGGKTDDPPQSRSRSRPPAP
jgi:hypothetical protein